jgi:hypothetical protein
MTIHSDFFKIVKEGCEHAFTDAPPMRPNVVFIIDGQVKLMKESTITRWELFFSVLAVLPDGGEVLCVEGAHCGARVRQLRPRALEQGDDAGKAHEAARERLRVDEGTDQQTTRGLGQRDGEPHVQGEGGVAGARGDADVVRAQVEEGPALHRADARARLPRRACGGARAGGEPGQQRAAVSGGALLGVRGGPHRLWRVRHQGLLVAAAGALPVHSVHQL